LDSLHKTWQASNQLLGVAYTPQPVNILAGCINNRCDVLTLYGQWQLQLAFSSISLIQPLWLSLSGLFLA